jgi:DNA repair protein RadC
MIIQLQEPNQAITRPAEVNAILQAVLKAEDAVDRDKEHFWVFHLDTRHRIKSLELVSLGTLDQSLVHPREVFTRAVVNRCHAILIAHNHPSGALEPSEEDIRITQRLVQAGEILGIEVVDHMIITGDDWLSLKQEGRL